MKTSQTVSIIKYPSYDSGLEDALGRLLHNIGGISTFAEAGKRILIKPNMLTDRTPDEAVTTHPELVRALIRLLKKTGASVSVGDSPASAVKIEQVWQKTGFMKMCDEENVPLLNFEESGSTRIIHDGFSFNIAKPVLETDLLINVPKVKTHTLTILTAAMKNLFGILPGYQKAHLHKSYPTPGKFGRMIHALYRALPPQLTIADAITGMSGNGPSAGKPVHLGFIAASTDAMALDLTLCSILGINPSSVPYLGPFDSGQSAISVKGDPIHAVAPENFKIPSTLPSLLIPEPLVKMLAPFIWFRPKVKTNCIACGLCVKACPVGALKIDPALKKAVLDAKRCISCCCCHEICPEKAIEMTQSPLLNLIRRGKTL